MKGPLAGHLVTGQQHKKQVIQCDYGHTWQDSEKDDDDAIEKEDVGNADPNSQPAPPVVNRQVNGAHDAITQSLACPSVWVQLVLPVTCRQGTSSYGIPS